MYNVKRKMQRSIFAKLLFVIILAGLLAILSTGAMLRIFSDPYIAPFRENAIHYTRYLIREIGAPPDLLKAREIAQELSIQIRFESPDFEWATSDNQRAFEAFDRMALDQNEKGPIKTIFDEGIYFVAVHQDAGRFLFVFDFTKSEYYKDALTMLLSVLLTVVFAGAYVVF